MMTDAQLEAMSRPPREADGWTARVPERPRLAQVLVAHDLVAQAFKTGNVFEKMRIKSGLPEGADLVGFNAMANPAVVSLLFSHRSFAPVEPGAEPPVIDVVIELQPTAHL